MYVALARTVLTDVDRDKIDDEVRKFRNRYPEYSRDDLVDRLIYHTAVRCGVIGAVASAPPGFLAVLPLAADFSYQPKISIVIPVYEIPLEILEQTIDFPMQETERIAGWVDTASPVSGGNE